MQLSFIAQLVQRLRSESPAFFKKLQAICGAVAALCYALAYLNGRGLILLPKPEVWSEVLKALANVCGGICFGTLTTTTDPKLIGKEVKEKVIIDVLKEGSPAAEAQNP